VWVEAYGFVWLGAVRELELAQLPFERPLLLCFPMDVILLLAKMRREISYRWSDAKGLVEGCLDGHGASTEATRFSRVASVELWIKFEWMRLYLWCWKDDSTGRMTDCCSTQSTRKGMGLVEKKGEFSRNNTLPWAFGRRLQSI